MEKNENCSYGWKKKMKKNSLPFTFFPSRFVPSVVVVIAAAKKKHRTSAPLLSRAKNPLFPFHAPS